ncbi:hypothetical protein [Actinoplanes sp. GCM10030250]
MGAAVALGAGGAADREGTVSARPRGVPVLVAHPAGTVSAASASR